jgi:hypothetical protein
MTLHLKIFACTLLLILPVAARAAGTGAPDGERFDCDWEFRSGPNAGLEGRSEIVFTLGAGNLQRSGNLLTTYPAGSSRNDAAVLDQPRIGRDEKLWRVRLPETNTTCTLHVQRGRLVFEGCSNGVHQTCTRQGASPQSTGPAPLWFVLEEVTIFDDHESVFGGAPELELYRGKLEGCSPSCPCNAGELFCQRLEGETEFVFDGGTHSDARGRQVRLPDVNQTGRAYPVDVALAPLDPFVRQHIVFLVEDDKDKGKLRLNDCIKLLACNFYVEPVGPGAPAGIKSCPSGTAGRVFSCLFGTGDDEYQRPVVLDVSLDPGESTVVTTAEFRLRYRLDH